MSMCYRAETTDSHKDGLRPSFYKEANWLQELDDRFYYPDCDGKWMFFFPRSAIDDRWNEAVGLYRAGKLAGVASMQVSTASPSPRAGDQVDHVILFFCGPSHLEDHVKRIGASIATAFPPGHSEIRYKSNFQTFSGTRATGQRINSLYRLRGCPTRPNESREEFYDAVKPEKTVTDTST
ncbi:uncharacterized protein LOC129597114 [Paramacrobiotus metropolitanus]|uniref:uncharacterized protein LOC129597114 n=1 Tax=Paramacrobiotus metropolitanus TaxID=2943436 RepID=UPI0024461040|nr:uncharacterized protein LOC129597114 [Paramacrobiotus metropolitanus]